MNYKILGAVLIIAACGSCGFLTAAHHVSKLQLLQNLICGLDFMVCERQYRATPLPQLCRLAGENCSGKIGRVFSLLADELETQISPNVGICMAAVLDKFNELDRTVFEILSNMGMLLGKFDLLGQISELESCRAHCIAKLEELNKDRDSRLRSYQTLGLCAGAAIAILFV